MSKQKAQGTRYETAVVNRLTGSGFPAERLAEGGAADKGDLRVHIHDVEWIGEAKARQTLPVHATVAKAKSKAGDQPVVVFWKRLVKGAGTRRVPVAGLAEVVVMAVDDYHKLLGTASVAHVYPADTALRSLYDLHANVMGTCRECQQVWPCTTVTTCDAILDKPVE